MDFIKSCSTNVQIIRNVMDLNHDLYLLSDETVPTTSTAIANILTVFRQHGVLVAIDRRFVHVFRSPRSEDNDETQTTADVARGCAGETDLKLYEEGTLNDQFEEEVTIPLLLEAMQGLLSYRLTTPGDMLRIGEWQWLTTNREDSEDIRTLVRVHASLDSNAKTLSLATETEVSMLASLEKAESRESAQLVLAPSGRAAHLYVAAENDDDGGQVVKGSHWRQAVIQTLASEAITITENELWVAVETGRDRFEWPAKLCFAPRQSAAVREALMLKRDHMDWKRWFAPAESEGYRNPLAVAEAFATSYADEQKMAAVYAAEMAHGQFWANNEATVATTSATADMDLITSPPFTQRPDLQAVSGVYPTPPDGLIPASQAAQTQGISSDSVPAQLQPEHSNSDPVQASSDEPAGERDRGQSLASLVGPTFQRDHSDDLFGDMAMVDGDIDFGADGGVGEEDFSFFDEPSPPPAVMEDATNAGHIQDEPATVPETPAETSSDQAAASGSALHEPTAPSENAGHAVYADNRASSPLELTPPPVEQQAAEQDVELYEDPGAPSPKPLSPFSIREQLLPPPIPASLSRSQGDESPANVRRTSSFGPMLFNDSSSRRSSISIDSANSREPWPGSATPSTPSIHLPLKRKRSHTLRPREEGQTPSTYLSSLVSPSPNDILDQDSESEEDSYSSDSDFDAADRPPQLPWSATKQKKRKKGGEGMTPLTMSFEHMWSDDEHISPLRESSSDVDVETVLQRLLKSHSSGSIDLEALTPSLLPAKTAPDHDSSSLCDMPPLTELFELNKQDLIGIAQLVAEQAVTVATQLTTVHDVLCNSTGGGTDHALQAAHERRMEEAIGSIFTSSVGRSNGGGIESELTTDLASLALRRDVGPPRQPTNPMKSNAVQPTQRPLQRSHADTVAGPDIWQIPVPFVRITRQEHSNSLAALAHWEMLPPALSFWEPLGLGPASGTKDVRAFAVSPDNEELRKDVELFVDQLGSAYEGCKLGMHVRRDPNAELVVGDDDGLQDGMVPVSIAGDEDITVEKALLAYSATCQELAEDLAAIATDEPDRSMVIYLIDPLSTDNQNVVRFLCACFWQLYISYRQLCARQHKSLRCSDIVLQILPVALIADPDTLVISESSDLATLAREVYDRCPPQHDPSLPDSTYTSPLPIPAAPCVELSHVPPKRIGFQLTSEPPSDLLHDGSILHLAYALSSDGQWLTAAWCDGTGRYAQTTAFCLRGTSFAEVAKDVWSRTMQVIAARHSSWRIFVVTPSDRSDDGMLGVSSSNPSLAAEAKCWREVLGTMEPRQQLLNVTLLTVELRRPKLRPTPLTPAAPADNTSGNNAVSGLTQGSGWLTPVSTPSANVPPGAFTVSPDATGSSHGAGHNAPPTPAPSDVAVAEKDPDAHLIDTTDESWGVMLPLDLASCASSIPSSNSESNSASVLSHGALIKRGDPSSPLQHHLPTLGASVVWTVRCRPTRTAGAAPGIDEGAAKQAEVTLREVLAMYRNLSVLTRARLGMEESEGVGVLPWHVLVALRGAEGLTGFLS